MEVYNEELLHYGIKGMKWGVRRTPAQLGYKSNKKTIREGLDQTGVKNYKRLHKGVKAATVAGAAIGGAAMVPLMATTGLGFMGSVGATIAIGAIGGASAGHDLKKYVNQISKGKQAVNKFKSMSILEDGIKSKNSEYKSALKSSERDPDNKAKRAEVESTKRALDYRKSLYNKIANEDIKAGEDYVYSEYYAGKSTNVASVDSAKTGESWYQQRIITY